MSFIIYLRGRIIKKYLITLFKDERETLRELASKGIHKSQKSLNAQILLGCYESEFQTESSREFGERKLKMENKTCILITDFVLNCPDGGFLE